MRPSGGKGRPTSRTPPPSDLVRGRTSRSPKSKDGHSSCTYSPDRARQASLSTEHAACLAFCIQIAAFIFPCPASLYNVLKLHRQHVLKVASVCGRQQLFMRKITRLHVCRELVVVRCAERLYQALEGGFNAQCAQQGSEAERCGLQDSVPVQLQGCRESEPG